MKELLTELRNKVLYLRNTEELSVKGELILLHKLNALEKQFAISGVSNCSGFKEDDLSKAYQAGALETYAEEIQPLTYDAIKQVEQNSLAWIKRWKE